jgi:hypothetical protein
MCIRFDVCYVLRDGSKVVKHGYASNDSAALEVGRQAARPNVRSVWIMRRRTV